MIRSLEKIYWDLILTSLMLQKSIFVFPIYTVSSFLKHSFRKNYKVTTCIYYSEHMSLFGFRTTRSVLQTNIFVKKQDWNRNALLNFGILLHSFTTLTLVWHLPFSDILNNIYKEILLSMESYRGRICMY